MHRFALALMLAGALVAQSNKKPPETLRGVLLEQLRSTYNQEEWFVPIEVAVKGLSPEQANWNDGKGNHSVGQLVYHLAFWDERSLERFNGKNPGDFKGSNDETFDKFDAKSWAATCARLDRVMEDWDAAVQSADEEKLKRNASMIAHIGTHNAYHIGQIIYIRKLQGSWNPANGVK